MSGAALKALSAAAEPEPPCRPRPASPLSRRPASAGVRVGGRCSASGRWPQFFIWPCSGPPAAAASAASGLRPTGAGDGADDRGRQPTTRLATPAIAQPEPAVVPAVASVLEARAVSQADTGCRKSQCSLTSEATAGTVDPTTTPAEAPPASETALGAFETDAAEVTPEAGMMKVALAEPRAAMPSFLAAGETAPPTYRTVLPGPATLRTSASRHHSRHRRDPLAAGRRPLRPSVRCPSGRNSPAFPEQPRRSRHQRLGPCSLRRSTCT